MNSNKKGKGLDGFPHVRKRNSISNKANSRATQNAVQRCTSLLRNNKSLAETLQETRCELSTYKNFFEDSLEYIAKAKLARSKMVQLSTSLNIFMKAFDETLLLMEFDDSKWPSIKAPKSSKTLSNGMNTVYEASNEVEEVVPTNQEMHCDEQNNFKASDQIFPNTSSPSSVLQNSVDEEESSGILKISRQSPQKKTEGAIGTDGIETEIHNSSPKKFPDSSQSSTSTQIIKKTKIPRCQGLAVTMKRQNFFKESEPQNCISSKQKSPLKMCEKSNIETLTSKRKTFVIKSNILTDSESATNQTDMERISNVPENVFISKKEKRKTYVKKILNIPSESEETASSSVDLEKDKRKTFVKKTFNISNESEETASNLVDLEKDKRKTFVKKPVNISNESEETARNVVHLEKDKRKTFVKKTVNISNESEETESSLVGLEKDKRKTFVKKPVNISNEFEETAVNLVDFEKDKRKTFVEKPINVSNVSDETASNVFDLKNDKRKTCTIKSNNTEKEIEPYVCLNKMQDEKFVPDNKITLSETSNIHDVFPPKNNRKTYAKKSSEKIVAPQNDVPEHLHSSPVKECIPVTSPVAERDKNSDTENLQASFEFQCNSNEVQMDLEAKTTEIIEPTVEPTVFNDSNKIFLNKKDILVADDKSEEISENLNPNIEDVIPDHSTRDISIHNIDKLNEGIIVSDASPEDKGIVHEVGKYSPIKTRKSFLETSESDLDVVFIEEIDFSAKKPGFKTTPVRGQVSRKKKKKFIFDANKRKSILKKNSLCESSADAECINRNDTNARKDKSVHFILDELVNKDKLDNLQSDVCGITRKKTSNKKLKKNQETSLKSDIAKTANKPHKIKVSKINSSKEAEADDFIPHPKKTKKKSVKKKNNKGTYFDDDIISKFRENNKIIPQIEDGVDPSENELETDFPCKKTGKNTFLVHAEIHAPPPFSNMPEIEKLDEETAKLKLKNMAVVLDDVLKSKDVKFLNEHDRNLLWGKTVSVSFSGSESNSSINPNESIEKLRCDPVPLTDDVCLHSDALLNSCDFDVQSDPGNEPENAKSRRRKNVNYKEPSLNRKMRRY